MTDDQIRIAIPRLSTEPDGETTDTRRDLAALEQRLDLRFGSLEERTDLRLSDLEERVSLRIDNRIHAEVNRLLLFLFPTIPTSLGLAVAVARMG